MASIRETDSADASGATETAKIDTHMLRLVLTRQSLRNELLKTSRRVRLRITCNRVCKESAFEAFNKENSSSKSKAYDDKPDPMSAGRMARGAQLLNRFLVK
ncbi:hypothetical protein M5K25_006032 [Dendrobium thyrsiflorum]|uniref:Uncharacterized protein n=1 Tax=Dendrobium thyrsiflorum TaxID=117978 RepID=A0ABD0VBA1_DENTH